MLDRALVWDFWWGGLGIAAVAFVVLIIGGKYLSVTRGYASLCSLVSRKEYFKRPDLGGKFGFRSMFVIGIILGGFISAIYNNAFQPGFSLGTFDQLFGDNLGVKAGILLFGGLLWGYGSRMAKGCTSGNSISGIAQGSLASVVATCCFLIGGVIVTYAIRMLGAQ